ncbi:MAG: HAD family hydrolase [Burkholderiales bacterium]
MKDDMKADLVFDFGGVVFNWQPLRLLRETLPESVTDEAQARSVAAQIFQSFSLTSDWALFDLGQIDAGPLAERIAKRSGMKEADVLRVIEAVPDHLVPIPGTVSLLQRLKAQGHRLFFLSNMPKAYALELERRNDLAAWFDGGVFSSRLQLIKPQPEIFHAAVQRFDLEPAKTVLVDDLVHNIEAARLQGWQGVHFQNPQQCGDALDALLLA